MPLAAANRSTNTRIMAAVVLIFMPFAVVLIVVFCLGEPGTFREANQQRVLRFTAPTAAAAAAAAAGFKWQSHSANYAICMQSEHCRSSQRCNFSEVV